MSVTVRIWRFSVTVVPKVRLLRWQPRETKGSLLPTTMAPYEGSILCRAMHRSARRSATRKRR